MPDSFYGGKPGSSFAIVKRFDTVEQMVNSFIQGPAYNEVNFDEYVIIDSVSDKAKYPQKQETGLIYQRGYNYLEDRYKDGENNIPNRPDILDKTVTEQQAAGETYIKALEDFNTKWINYITSPGGGAIYIGQIIGPEGLTPYVEWVKESAINQVGNYAGKIEMDRVKGGLNTKATYTYANIFDGTNGRVSNCQIGFTIPYDNLGISAKQVSPYAVGENEELMTLSSDSFTNENPYYGRWSLKVPKGKQGTSIEEVGINENSYFYYKIRDYENSALGTVSGEKVLGLYKVIDDMTFNNKTSSIEVDYSNGDNENFFIKQLKDIKIATDADGGQKFQVTTTDAEGPDYETSKFVSDYLKVINKVELKPNTSIADSDLVVTYGGVPANQATVTIPTTELKTINKLEVVDDNGSDRLKVTYQGLAEGSGTSSEYLTDVNALKTLKNIEIVKDGTVDKFKVTYDGVNSGAEVTLPQPITGIDSLAIANDNGKTRLQITYTGKYDSSGNLLKEFIGPEIKYIKDLTTGIDTDGSTKLKVTYINGNNVEDSIFIGDALKTINTLTIDENTQELQVSYNGVGDTSFQVVGDPIISIDGAIKNNDKLYLHYNSTLAENVLGGTWIDLNNERWQEIGVIVGAQGEKGLKGDSGGFTIYPKVFKSVSELPSTGFPNGEVAAVEVVVGETTSTTFYLFDETKSQWVDIGGTTSSSSASSYVFAAKKDTSTDFEWPVGKEVSDLSSGAVWVVIDSNGNYARQIGVYGSGVFTLYDIRIDTTNIDFNTNSASYTAAQSRGLEAPANLDVLLANIINNYIKNGDTINAETANSLANKTKIGDINKPVYFNNGQPVAINYTINANVPSNAVFTDRYPDIATTSTLGIVKLGNDTKISTGSKVYPLQLTTNNQAFVSVPWIDTDTKVIQTNSTTNAEYRMLLSGSANDVTETAQSFKNSNLRANPSTGEMFATKYRIGENAFIEYDNSNKCINFNFL